MKLIPTNEEIVLEGKILDGPEAGDVWDARRRAERFVIRIWPEPEQHGPSYEDALTVMIEVKGRKVTKSGAVSKRDTFFYNIFDRNLEHLVGAAAVAEGILDSKWLAIWKEEHNID